MTSPHINNPYIIENTVSHERIFKTMPNDEEIFCKNVVMMSETDTEGIITYANRQFREKRVLVKKN